MSLGGISTEPPSSVALAADASQFSTPNHTLHAGYSPSPATCAPQTTVPSTVKIEPNASGFGLAVVTLLSGPLYQAMGANGFYAMAVVALFGLGLAGLAWRSAPERCVRG